MGRQPTVFVVDDDPGIRSSLELLCNSVGLPIRTFVSAQRFLDECEFDARGCVIVDIRMPVTNGLELLQRMQTTGHTLPVLVLTSYGDVPTAVRAMKGGAVDFLEKPIGEQALLERIQEAMQRDAAREQTHGAEQAVRQRLQSLTKREREVLNLVVRGLSSKETAERLGISYKTIAAHRARILKKMDCHNVRQLIRFCYGIEGDEPAPG